MILIYSGKKQKLTTKILKSWFLLYFTSLVLLAYPTPPNSLKNTTRYLVSQAKHLGGAHLLCCHCPGFCWLHTQALSPSNVLYPTWPHFISPKQHTNLIPTLQILHTWFLVLVALLHRMWYLFIFHIQSNYHGHLDGSVS